MPSFLTDENAPIYSQSGGIIDFLPHQHQHQTHDPHLITSLVSGKTKSPDVTPHELHPSPAHTRNGSYDESSAQSTHTEVSDSRSHPNGSATRPTSMSSLTNGKPNRGASVSTVDDDEHITHIVPDIPQIPKIPDTRPPPAPPTCAPPPVPISIVDLPTSDLANDQQQPPRQTPPPQRAPPPPPIPAPQSQQQLSSAPPSSPPQRTPPSAPTGAPPAPPSREPPDAPNFALAPAPRPRMNGGTRSHDGFSTNTTLNPGLTPLETIPSGSPLSAIGPPGPSPSLPAPNHNPKDDPRRRSHSPNRSSIYPNGNGNGNASSSTSALNPMQASGLKHRHTLEVPGKAGGSGGGGLASGAGGRGSRDGTDTAFASGRFSPAPGVASSMTSTGGGRRGSLSLGRKNTKSLHSDMVRDEVVPDEDALRWAEAYRQKRAKQKSGMDEDRVLVGTKVDETHQNWVTAYNMLTGIRVSVSRTNAKIDRELMDTDFTAKQKSSFDIAGNELVPSAKYDFKFKDYAPWVFRTLRSKFKLDPADYLMSLTGKYILSELGSPGKSGSFFYFSRDYKYIIKTIHHAEHKFLRKILKQYYQHVLDNPNTLLSQFYGLHRVKMPWGKKIHFVVMNNLFPPHRDIHMTFDLKGSTIGRNYAEEDIADHPRATLKDLNWMRRKRNLELGIQKKKLFLEQLQRDVRLLQRLEIMDYSLLIGVHDLQRGNDENLRGKTLKVFNPGGEEPDPNADPHTVLMRTPSKLENEKKTRELRHIVKSGRPTQLGMTLEKMPETLDEPRKNSVFCNDDGGFGATHEDNSPANEVYYLGVIDCLTHYGMIKKIEHFWKGLSNDRTQISALPPQEYGERFYQFIEGVTMSQEAAARRQIEEEEAEVAAAQRSGERVSSWSSRKSGQVAPPVPGYKLLPPGAITETEPTTDGDIPERSASTQRESHTGGVPSSLPILEETAESSSSARSRANSSGRSLTPQLVDGLEAPERPPPTPPKVLAVHGLKNVDSGYADRLKPRPSRESLDKALPPIPSAGA